MNEISNRIAEAGIEVIRFEFEYMARRREDGQQRGPDRPPKLIARFTEVLDLVGPAAELVIGGKSMGGRIASMMADEAAVLGAVCLGYPFHPPGKPENLRTTHLRNSSVPTLLVQGERDPFGGADEVVAYKLPGSLTLHWITDGDHDLKPRKASGRTAEQNWAEGAAAIAEWAAELGST